MYRFLFTFVMAVATYAAQAQSVGDMFVNIPDSIFPYLDKNQRAELRNLKRLDDSTAAVLHSHFERYVTLNRCETELMELKIDSTLTIEMARVATVNGDSLYCLLRTVAVPERETVAYIYNNVWEKVADVVFDDVTLLQRPDTMSQENFAELEKLIEFRMMEAHFSDAETLVLQQNVPMTSKEDKTRLQAILTQRKLKWDGKTYKIN